MIAPATNEAAELLWSAYVLDRSTASRNALVEHYLPVARRAAAAMHRRTNADYDDLLASGSIGLMQAVETFDLGRGVRFETYCVPRVRGAMIDALRDADHLGRADRMRVTALSAISEDKTIGELVDVLGVPAPEVRRLLVLRQAATTASLSSPMARNGGDSRRGETLCDRVYAPMADSITIDDVDEIERAMRGLTRTEREVLFGYFHDGETLREIGERLGFSESHISQLLSKLLPRLASR